MSLCSAHVSARHRAERMKLAVSTTFERQRFALADYHQLRHPAILVFCHFLGALRKAGAVSRAVDTDLHMDGGKGAHSP